MHVQPVKIDVSFQFCLSCKATSIAKRPSGTIATVIDPQSSALQRARHFETCSLLGLRLDVRLRVCDLNNGS